MCWPGLVYNCFVVFVLFYVGSVRFGSVRPAMVSVLIRCKMRRRAEAEGLKLVRPMVDGADKLLLTASPPEPPQGAHRSGSGSGYR